MTLRAADVYITVAIADLAKVDFSQVGETSENTIRKSLDGTEFVLKYNAEPVSYTHLTLPTILLV